MGTCGPHIFPPGSPGLLSWAWTGAWEGTTSLPHPKQQGYSLSTSMRRKISGLQTVPLTLRYVARILKGTFRETSLSTLSCGLTSYSLGFCLCIKGHLTNCMCEMPTRLPASLPSYALGTMGDDVREGPGTTLGALLKLGMRAGRPTLRTALDPSNLVWRVWYQQRYKVPSHRARGPLKLPLDWDTHTHTHKGRHSLSLWSSPPEQSPALARWCWGSRAGT